MTIDEAIGLYPPGTLVVINGLTTHSTKYLNAIYKIETFYKRKNKVYAQMSIVFRMSLVSVDNESYGSKTSYEISRIRKLDWTQLLNLRSRLDDFIQKNINFGVEIDDE
jgi:hypothetical protein